MPSTTNTGSIYMNDPEQYDAIVIGGGKGGKTLAMYLGRRNDKTRLNAIR